MVVKVYGPVTAACPQRVLTCLVEKEMEFEVIPIDLAGEQKRPDFLSLQPFGQVPVIQDGDLRLFESRAISRYYAAKYAEKGSNLLGKTLEEQAQVEQWMEVEAHHLHEAVYEIVMQLRIIPRVAGKSSDMRVVEECKRRLEKVLDVYEQQLSKRLYLAGDDFTLADLTNLPPLRHVMNEMPHLVRQRKRVSAWWDTISSRPSWKKIMSLIAN